MIPREQPGPLLNGLPTNLPDTDPEETNEWLESLDGLIEAGGRNRARFVMLKLNERARDQHVGVPSLVSTDYVNTIPKSREVPYPGDPDLEQDIRHMLRWNSAIQVHRQQRPGIGVGGHISSYASSATLYEVGLQHFWRGKDHPGGGDQIYFQGHSSPGPYARAFLEGRLSEADMDGFRQEYSRPAGGRGLPSYPHPRRMEDFWEFPTVSMGIGPINAIYQASFNKYLDNRGIKDTSQQHVWAFLGDGEMDEVESAVHSSTPPTRAGQPHLRHQLQPAAPGRPGTGQRQDHPGTGDVLPRRRLERYQGDLGRQLGSAARERH